MLTRSALAQRGAFQLDKGAFWLNEEHFSSIGRVLAHWGAFWLNRERFGSMRSVSAQWGAFQLSRECFSPIGSDMAQWEAFKVIGDCRGGLFVFLSPAGCSGKLSCLGIAACTRALCVIQLQHPKGWLGFT